MDVEVKESLRGRPLRLWRELLKKCGLSPDEQLDRIVLIWDKGRLAATGGRLGNLFKCIAVDDDYQGMDLTASVLTALRQDAYLSGCERLFLYTKPKNRDFFQTLFFYPVAATKEVLLMESPRDGIQNFISCLPAAHTEGPIGAAVMNCNPFTKGHRYLIETAARECGHLYVFVLSEDRSEFTAAQRMDMVRLGVQDLKNVTVLPTGPYLISSTTFPTYFLKDRDQVSTIHCLLDIQIFVKYFVPHFGITRRYVGTEPLSPMTALYNQALREHLPGYGVALRELERLTAQGKPVSASAVREMLKNGDLQQLSQWLPDTTLEYLKNMGVGL